MTLGGEVDTARHRRLAGVDALRAVGALAVFGVHLVAYWSLQDRLPFHLTEISELGARGVDLFVVISGFCLAWPVVRGVDRGPRSFYTRRAARIGPPYYVTLALCAVLAVVPTTARYVVAEPADAGDVLLHALLLQTLVPGEAGTINGSLWSIALEAQLYLVFPLVVLIWRRFGLTPVLLGATALSLAWGASGHVSDVWVLGDNRVIFDRFVQFAGGMLAAKLVAEDRVPVRRALWAGLLVGGLAAIVVNTVDLPVGSSIIWTVPAVSAVLLGYDGFPGRAGRALTGLGIVSYSFYLLQQPILLLTEPVAHQLTERPLLLLALGTTGCLALTVVASWGMYRLVEAPSLALGVRLSRRGSIGTSGTAHRAGS